MTNTPRVADFKGLYNVDPTLVGETMPFDEDFLCIRKGLAPPSYAEIDRVADLIVRFANEVGGSSDAVSYSVGFEDRTALVTFRLIDMLTNENLELLRQHLQDHTSDWRIIVCGVSDATSICIYPSKIVLPQDGNPSRVVGTIRDALIEQHENTDGVHERQLAYVKIKIRQANIPPIPYEPIILAAFDSERGNPEEVAIWILQSGYAHLGLSWLADDDMGDGFLGQLGSSEFDVTESRKLVGFMDAEDSFVGCLNAYAYDKSRFSHEIILVNPYTNEIQRRSISKSDLLSDHDVKAMLAQSGEWK